MAVDQALLDAATAALAVTDVRELRPGAQKTVRLVQKDGSDLVMKVISLESGAPDALRRAQREVELLQQIDNDHVVKVASDLVELDDPLRGVAWLEEYLDGSDLVALLGAQWSWDETKAMSIDVSEGLSALHAVGVVHRDLSANNVRKTSAGQYVVMDPGFARHTLRSGLTIGGQPGTPGFLSPEHLSSFSGAPTPASDVFCVDVSDYLRRLSQVEVTDIEAFRQDLTPEVVALIHRTLHPQPARRPRNGARLRQDLEGLA
jgi:serine/threonine protein kinase